MKIKQILDKCPKCGNQDKRVRRSISDKDQSPGEISGLICDNCDYVFEIEKDKKKKNK